MKTRPWLLAATALGVVTLIISGCGGGSTTATPAPTAQPTTTPTAAPIPPSAVPTVAATLAPATPTTGPAPKRGGILTSRYRVESPVRDPYDSRGVVAIFVMQPLTDTLVMTNPYNLQTSSEVIGGLAETWQTSVDGTLLTFKLPKGTRWHDGTPFTSKDVAYTYNRAITPPEPTVVAQKLKFTIVSKIETPDDQTVVITLKRPSAYFLQAIALSLIVILPSHVPAADWNKSPVGTGAFKFKSDKDGQFEVERNPTYFKQGLPYLDGVKYYLIADAALAKAAFLTGQWKAANPLQSDFSGSNPDQIRRAVRQATEQFFTGQRQDLEFNNTGPLVDVRVRQAMSMALDRHEFNRLWLPDIPDKQVPLASFMVPASRGGRWALPDEEILKIPGYNPAAKQADIEKAKQLIKDAGFQLPLSLKFRTSSEATYQRAAEAYTSLLKAAGIVSPALELVPPSQTVSGRRTGGWDIWDGVAAGAADDPAENLLLFVSTNGGANYSKWSFPEVDRLLDLQDTVLDPARRLQVMWDLQRQLFKDLPRAPIGYFGTPLFNWPEIKNVGRCYFAFSPCYRWDQTWIDT